MRHVSAAELKANLSDHLTAVRRGEDVIVTDAGRPIARLSGLNDVSIPTATRGGTAGASAAEPAREVGPDFDDGIDHRGRLLQVLLADSEGRR